VDRFEDMLHIITGSTNVRLQNYLIILHIKQCSVFRILSTLKVREVAYGTKGHRQ
jgi:hypothetical protein